MTAGTSVHTSSSYPARQAEGDEADDVGREEPHRQRQTGEGQGRGDREDGQHQVSGQRRERRAELRQVAGIDRPRPEEEELEWRQQRREQDREEAPAARVDRHAGAHDGPH
jgi:hypothetical protein